MSAHTPGPWVVINAKGYFPYQIRAPQQSQDRPGGIVDITRWASITMPSSREGQANARLIAAAPDLLAVCQWLRTYAEVQVLVRPDAEDAPHWHDLLAAIAKAEGTTA